MPTSFADEVRCHLSMMDAETKKVVCPELRNLRTFVIPDAADDDWVYLHTVFSYQDMIDMVSCRLCRRAFDALGIYTLAYLARSNGQTESDNYNAKLNRVGGLARDMRDRKDRVEGLVWACLDADKFKKLALEFHDHTGTDQLCLIVYEVATEKQPILVGNIEMKQIRGKKHDPAQLDYHLHDIADKIAAGIRAAYVNDVIGQ